MLISRVLTLVGLLLSAALMLIIDASWFNVPVWRGQALEPAAGRP